MTSVIVGCSDSFRVMLTNNLLCTVRWMSITIGSCLWGLYLEQVLGGTRKVSQKGTFPIGSTSMAIVKRKPKHQAKGWRFGPHVWGYILKINNIVRNDPVNRTFLLSESFDCRQMVGSQYHPLILEGSPLIWAIFAVGLSRQGAWLTSMVVRPDCIVQSNSWYRGHDWLREDI